MNRPTILFVCAAAIACTGVRQHQNGNGAEEPIPLLDGTGPHRRQISRGTPDAQRYFDQALNLLFAFNHDEARRSFHRAAELAPDAAMPWWGVAISHGPHINKPAVTPEQTTAAAEAAQRARERAAGTSEVERALIEALSARYTVPVPADRKPLDLAYAQAMRGVWQRFPEDGDVGALFAESLMDLRPWDLWTAAGEPQPGTEEVVTTLEKVLAVDALHPLANHLYIHAVEASPTPGRADAAADRLRDLTPGLGHMVHMPSHIDVRRGRWLEAITANEKAIAADRRYRELRPEQGFYRVYMAHNHHMLAYALMMTGQSERATAAMDAIVEAVPAGWAQQNADVVDGFMAMPLEVRMRFGRWDDILHAAEPAAHFPLSRALWRYARGVARAAKGQTAEARAEQRAFLQAKAKIPAGATFGNNAATALIAVAEPLLEGEILYREGKVPEGLAALRQAVQAEDALRYAEPPDWILPTRHALGATLLQERRAAEAEQVFREDQNRLPSNGWSLFGLGQALRLQRKEAEAAKVDASLEQVWKRADVSLRSPCFCQPGL